MNYRSNGMETSIKEGQEARYLLNFYDGSLVMVKLGLFAFDAKNKNFFSKNNLCYRIVQLSF